VECSLYPALVFLALSSDRRVVAAGRRCGRARPVQSDGDADARDADERHWDEVDDDEEQQEEAATELSAEVVEPVGADLPRRRAVPASYTYCGCNMA